MTRSWSIFFLASLVISLLTMMGCVEEPTDEEWITGQYPVHRVCGGDQTLHGIDISHWQGTINWNLVATSGKADFAYIRIGDGLGTDSKFAYNWPEALRVGVPRGAYHFFRPGSDALAQAQHFMSMVNDAGGYLEDDLPPMIDVEATDGQTAATIRAQMQIWIDYVQEQTGKQPIIYTGPYFWDDNGLGSTFADLHLWTAHYTTACPLIPNAWSSWTIWQYSSSGSVSGISGNVDMNRFNGTATDLALWPRCSTYRPISGCLPPDWWCAPLASLHEFGILSRTCADFLNGDRFNRAELAKIIGSAIQIEATDAFDLCRLPFSDIAEDAWYARYVAALAALDHGDGETVFSTAVSTFNPSNYATRCEMVKMVVEAWDLPAADNFSLLYTDMASVPSWCVPFLKRAAAANIVQHGTLAFRPTDETTVGEAAAMVNNAIQSFGRPTPEAADFNDPSCQPPITCTDQCVLDQLQCTGQDVLPCQLLTNGCTAWGQPYACPPRTGCSAGECVDICGEECTFQARQCVGDSMQICTVNAQGCYVWGVASACADGQTCRNGTCVDACILPGADCGSTDTSADTSTDTSTPEDTSTTTTPHDTWSGSPDLPSDDNGAFQPSPGIDPDCGCTLVRHHPSQPWGLFLLLLGLIGIGRIAGSEFMKNNEGQGASCPLRGVGQSPTKRPKRRSASSRIPH